jgi:glycosyltransferase involved in cell wall biosynthesis
MLMTEHMVSVLMPIRNGESFLEEAMDSLRQQTLRNWELVAVLDGSTDNSEAILRRYADHRVRVFSLPRPGGFAAALNFGLANCRAEYVARFDQDDVCLPHRLEAQLEVLAGRPDLVVLGGEAQLCDETSRIVGKRSVPSGPRRVQLRLLLRNQMIHPAVMFRRSVIAELGGYRSEAAPMFEDYDLWLRVLGYGEVDNLAQPLIKYRIHRGQQSRRSTLSRTAMATVSQSRRLAARRLGTPQVAVRAMELAWLAGQVRHELVVVNRRRQPSA